MSKSDILSWFSTNSVNLTAQAIIGIMCSALIVAAVIFLTYRFTYKGVSYNQKFNVSNVLILLITVVIMLMISSNIVISLGMVGALSIVRFRTAIKDPRDTIFIFWSITEGLCVGSQNFKLAFISTVFIAIVMLLFHQYQYLWNKYIIIIRGEGKDNILINKECLLEKIIPYSTSTKIRSNSCSENYEEIILEIRVRKELNPLIVKDLLEVSGVKSVNYLMESAETVG